MEIGSAADFKAIAQICRPSLPDAIALPCHQDPETEKWLNNEHTVEMATDGLPVHGTCFP